MSDQLSDNSGDNSGETRGEVVQNGNGKLYPCNYCDKLFVSGQALGGHRNSHRNEQRIALRPPQLSLPVESYDRFSVPPPLPMPNPFMVASDYLYPMHVLSYGDGYGLPTVVLVGAPTNNYQAHGRLYNLLNLFPGPNGFPNGVNPNPRVNPSIRLFGITLYGMPVDQSTEPAHGFSGCLDVKMDGGFLKWQNNPSGYEYGSSSGTRKDDEVPTSVNPIPRVNPGPMLFGKPLYGMPVDQSTVPAYSFTGGLNIERDEGFMNFQNTHTGYEHGSSSWEKEALGGTAKEGEEGELDLTLHL